MPSKLRILGPGRATDTFPMSTHALPMRYPCVTDARVYPHQITFFEKLLFSDINLYRKFLKKVCFLIGIRAFLSFCGKFRPPSSKKAKTKRFYTPPLGGKKTTEFVSPPKESFGKSKAFFMFEVGAKIDI